MNVNMNTIEELPNLVIHPENRIEYYQQTKLRVVLDFKQIRKLKYCKHFIRSPWQSEIWESLVYFGKKPKYVKVQATSFKIIREFYFI